MDEYKGNSNRAKEEERKANEKRASKVISGDASVRKQNRLGKLIGDEAVSKAGDKLGRYFEQKASDVICTVVNTISDVICNIINVRITGEPMSRKSNSPGSRVSYRKYFDDDDDDDARPAHSKKSRGNYNDILFWDCPEKGISGRAEAEVALESMEEMLESFNVVRVADLYDFAGLAAECDYNNNKFGWYEKDIAEAYVDYTYATDPKDGRRKKAYFINLPKASAL